MPGSVESYLRTSAEHLLGKLIPNRTTTDHQTDYYLVLGHVTVTRGESRRDVQLANMILIDLENEAPRLNESVPCMIMTMRQGK
jgi:hypothetical protein